MQDATIAGLNTLLADFEQLLRDIPEAKKEMLGAIGQEMKDEVDRNIVRTVNDSHGKVRRWQDYHVGTYLGYAAVRANGSGEGAETGYGSPGYITNILENGRRQKPGRYVPELGLKLKQKKVYGRHFYKNARSGLQSLAYKAAEACAKRLAAHLED